MPVHVPTQSGSSWGHLPVPRPVWVADDDITYKPGKQTTWWSYNHVVAVKATINKYKYFQVMEDTSGWPGAAYVRKTNSYTKNNLMHVRVHTDHSCSTQTCAPDRFTTGLIRSKFAFRQGYIEVKAKLPRANVVGSMWLTGARSGIKVFSICANDATNTVTSEAHVDSDVQRSRNSAQTSTSTKKASIADVDFSAWNIYGLEWTHTGDLLVSVNGGVVNHIAGSEWNPRNMQEDLALVLELSVDPRQHGAQHTDIAC